MSHVNSACVRQSLYVPIYLKKFKELISIVKHELTQLNVCKTISNISVQVALKITVENRLKKEMTPDNE